MREISILKERILQYLDFKGIRKSAFYKEASISNGILSQSNGLSEDNLMRILNFYSDINPIWLLTGKGDMLQSPENAISTASVANTSNLDGIENVIPLIPYSAIAGFGSGDVPAIMEHDIIDRYVVPGLKYVDFLIRVDGDSMEPTYEKGDVIACQIIHDGSFIQWGKTFVLDTEQGVLLKRLQPGQTENEYLCKSDNPNYQEFAIPKKQINNLALVKGLIRIE